VVEADKPVTPEPVAEKTEDAASPVIEPVKVRDIRSIALQAAGDNN